MKKYCLYVKKGKISVLVEEEADFARIKIQDTGFGIEEEQMSDIFTAFKQSGRISSIGKSGLGLGLFICKKIIEAHGGDIWITSAGTNLGTEVYILLPLMNKGIK